MTTDAILATYDRLVQEDDPSIREFLHMQPQIEVIQRLLKVIPYFYKRGGRIDSNEKHYLEYMLRDNTTYVSRLDVILAFSLLSPAQGGKFPFKRKGKSLIQKMVKQRGHVGDVDILNGSAVPATVRAILQVV